MAQDYRPPSFYHILLNPSSPHLPLPLKFVKKHLRNRALKDPILKSANGGYLWKLKTKKFDDHTFNFVNGWCNVVKDLGLLFGEFLLFKYLGSSVFLMHVYSVNGCEKILVPRIINNFKVVEDDEVSDFEDDEVVFDNNDDDDDVEYDVEEEDEDVAEEDAENDVDVDLGDDDEEEENGEDEDDVDVDGDDGDPFFVITSSKRNKNKLRFPPDLVTMAKIKTKETITLKNDYGYEKEMPVRSYKQYKSTRYYMAEGWEEFQRSSNISEGDECVLKFITSEDKLCLANVTKKKPRATKVDNDDMDDDDGMDEKGEAEDAKEDDSNVDGDDIFVDDVDDEGKDEYAKFVNDDEDNEDDDRDIDGDDGDPSFILTLTHKNQYHLHFSKDFVALAGINTKKNITLKNLDGYEKVLRVRSRRGKFPGVRSGRPNRWRSYYLGVGWKEFQRNSNISEGDRFVFKFITSEDKFCVAKITKNITWARPLPPAVKAPVTEVDDGMDEVADPFFVVDITKTHKFMLWLPPDFVELAGIDGKKSIIIKCLDGNEIEMVLRPVKQVHSTRYCLSMGWRTFRRSNNLSEGDKFVFKYITSEDKMFVAKISKKITPPTEVDNDLKVDDGKDVMVYDNKDEDENVEPVDDGMDGKDVVVGDNKDEDEVVELVDDGMDVDADDDKDADEDAELVENGMEVDAGELVDDVMDDKDVDEYAKLVDGMYDKDENEDAELVDDEDPFFRVTISPSHKSMLRLPPDFVGLAGINTKQNIIIKGLDGNESQMAVRFDGRFNSSRYHLSKGWADFMRSNNLSQARNVYLSTLHVKIKCV